MKRLITTAVVAVATALPGPAALAQQKMDDMKGMDMGKKPAAGAQASASASVRNIRGMPG